MPLGSKLVGFVSSRDGGVPGYGTLLHALYQTPNSEVLGKSLVAAKSKINRRSIFVHELLSITMSLDLMLQCMKALEFDHKHLPLKLINLGDSACVSHLFNTGIRIKSTMSILY